MSVPAPLPSLPVEEIKAICRNSNMENFVVWESRLVPGTLGVFARRLIRKGTVFGKYMGREFPTMRKLLMSNPGSAYALEVVKKAPTRRTVYMDGDYHVYPEESCVISLINGTKYLNDGNAHFRTNGGVISRRAIQPGEEIVCYYGHDYFDSYEKTRTVRKSGGRKAIRLSEEEFERAAKWNDEELC